MTALTTIATELQKAKQTLSSSSDTPLLDAEILLSTSLSVSRGYLFAFPERELTQTEIHSFEKLIELRRQKMPIAYITGHKEFWSLDLIVTKDTLIPRPETELLVELVLQQVTGAHKKIADLGTGSGAIALALGVERPAWKIHATDVSMPALEIAKKNAARFKLSNIFFYQGNWLTALPEKNYDAIVSNPPYIAVDDPYLQQQNLKYEPHIALMSDENGLKAVRHIITHAKNYLTQGGRVLIEHGFEQASEIRRIFKNLDYSNIDTYQDLNGLDRVTGAKTKSR